MNEELKPCPFRGSVAKDMNNYWVRCKDCEDDCFLENVQLKDIQLMAAAQEMLELLDDALLELSLVSGILEPNNGHVEALIERINKFFQRIKGEDGVHE